MARDDLNCREFVEFLDAYLDEELDRPVRRTFETHMCDCPPCRDYLETYRDTVRLARSLCDEDRCGRDLPEDVPEPLIRAILEARKKTP